MGRHTDIVNESYLSEREEHGDALGLEVVQSGQCHVFVIVVCLQSTSCSYPHLIPAFDHVHIPHVTTPGLSTFRPALHVHVVDRII